MRKTTVPSRVGKSSPLWGSIGSGVIFLTHAVATLGVTACKVAIGRTASARMVATDEESELS